MVLLNISSSVHGDLDTNDNIRLNKSTSSFSYVKPGVYEDIELLVAEINELDSISKHLKFKVARGGYITVERICTDDTCSALKHTLQLSKRLRNILGFDPYVHDIHVNLKEPTVGKFPALIRATPLRQRGRKRLKEQQQVKEIRERRKVLGRKENQRRR
ncbi:hypothetical protein QAD02_007363 [Eretmocerus hayati]|uniref:Uncharacterized protein n=1 Tax=Eretmocerus hayati TaxID=131215 RepID=A0ACC2N490_9HYME|nr:hypothetical protein QAD02_007363 [Eretmocerus hayati]